VSVVDSYFFDIIDDLAQDAELIQDFGPVAMPVQSSRGSAVSSAVSYAIPDTYVDLQGIVSASAAYVNPKFGRSNSFLYGCYRGSSSNSAVQ